MKKLVTSILSLAVVAGLGQFCIRPGERRPPKVQLRPITRKARTPHYPLKHPREQEWSFAGPFGHYDKGQLQRGLKVYTEVCSACHSMSLVSFRTLGDLGYSEAQVKAFAANYEVQDGPNAERRDVYPQGGAFRPLPVAVPERRGRRCIQQWRGAAGLLADRQGARHRARLPASSSSTSSRSTRKAARTISTRC